MTANYFWGSLSTNTSTGNQSVTGVGFQPTLVIFYSWGKTTTLTGTADASQCVGAATSSTARWATSRFSKDAQASDTIAVNNVSNKCITYKDNTGVIFEADFVSMDADGFTFNLTTAAASARQVFYLAVNGVTATAGTFTTNLVTGTQAVTGVGFRPTSIIFKGENTSGTIHDDIGAAVSTSSRWYMDNFEVAANPSSCRTIFGSSFCYSKYGVATPQYEADFTSFDSDGFTVNCSTNNGVAQTINYIAIKDIQVALGNFLTGTTGADVSVSGLAFSPGAVIFTGQGQITTTENSQTLDATRSFGIASSTTKRGAFAYFAGSGVTPSQNKSDGSTSSIYQVVSHTATVLMDWDIKSFDATGFTIKNTTTDNNTRRVYYIAFEGVPISVSGSSSTLLMMGV